MKTLTTSTAPTFQNAFQITRSEQANKIKGLISNNSFVALMGRESSGKTTIVKKEIIPALQQGEIYGDAGNTWRIAFTRPGSDPIGSLARDLASPGALLDSSPLNYYQEVEKTLRSGSNGLSKAYQNATTSEGSKYNLMVIVEALEDLPRFKKFMKADGKAGDDVTYVSLLLAAAKAANAAIYVLVLARTEYIEPLAKYQGLLMNMNRSGLSIRKLQLEQMNKAVQDTYSANPKFVSAVLGDLQTLENKEDPDILVKLQYTISQCEKYVASNPKASLADAYGIIGGLIKSINYSSKKKYEKLTDEQKAICEQSFKILIRKNPNFRLKSRPDTLGNLLAIISKDETNPVSKDNVVDVLQKLNSGDGIDFIDFISPGRGLSEQVIPVNNTIIDISGLALLRNWSLLEKWVDEELFFANIYIKLASDAINWKNGNGVLYDDLALKTALNMKEKAKPNEAWSKRYRRSISFNETENLKATNLFQLAMDFLEKSRLKAIKDQKDAEKAQQEKKKRKNRLITIFSIITAIAVITTIWAIISKSKVEKTKTQLNTALENLDLLTFVDELLSSKIIEPSDKIGILREKITQMDSINNNGKVLDFLEKNEIIYLEKGDNISRNAFLEFDNLFDAKREYQALTNISKKALKLSNDATEHSSSYRQFPFVFKLLNETVGAYRDRNNGWENYRFKQEAFVSAVATNPEIDDQFAFGNRNGEVTIHGKGTTQKEVSLHESINTLQYTRDGTILLAGTKSGKIFVLRNMGNPDLLSDQFDYVQFDGGVRNIAISKGNRFFVISTADKVYLYDRQRRKIRDSIDFGTTLQTAFITNTDPSGDHLLVGGTNKTLIYQISGTTRKEKYNLNKKGVILHPGHSISAVAFDHTGKIALGSEAGHIWVTKWEENKKVELPEEIFRKHNTLVSSLQFHPSIPQLASSSFDGTIRLWNLDKKANLDDHIVLRDNGQSIWGICYNNQNYLISIENNTVMMWPTTIQVLKKELKGWMTE